jgi:hypothetical protein
MRHRRPALRNSQEDKANYTEKSRRIEVLEKERK